APGVGKVRKAYLQSKATKQRTQSVQLHHLVSTSVVNEANKRAKSELSALHKRPEFQNINYRDEKGHPQFDTKKFTALNKAAADIWMKHLHATVAPQHKFEVKESKNTWELRHKVVAHSDSSNSMT